MAEIRKWQYGDNGETVKNIIDFNFNNLNTQVNQLANRYVCLFTVSDWKDGSILINYSQHLKLNPCVDLYIKTDTGYSFVYGGYVITDKGIELQSDIAYDGKVVIR